MRPEPFSLHVPDESIADLRRRLAATRFPDQAPGEPWAYGTGVGYMRDLVRSFRLSESVLGYHSWLHFICRLD